MSPASFSALLDLEASLQPSEIPDSENGLSFDVEQFLCRDKAFGGTHNQAGANPPFELEVTVGPEVLSHLPLDYFAVGFEFDCQFTAISPPKLPQLPREIASNCPAQTPGVHGILSHPLSTDYTFENPSMETDLSTAAAAAAAISASALPAGADDGIMDMKFTPPAIAIPSPRKLAFGGALCSSREGLPRPIIPHVHFCNIKARPTVAVPLPVVSSKPVTEPSPLGAEKRKRPRKKSAGKKGVRGAFSCDVCNTSFTLRKNLRRHMSMHDVNSKRFLCTWYVRAMSLVRSAHFSDTHF